MLVSNVSTNFYDVNPYTNVHDVLVNVAYEEFATGGQLLYAVSMFQATRRMRRYYFRIARRRFDYAPDTVWVHD